MELSEHLCSLRSCFSVFAGIALILSGAAPYVADAQTVSDDAVQKGLQELVESGRYEFEYDDQYSRPGLAEPEEASSTPTKKRPASESDTRDNEGWKSTRRDGRDGESGDQPEESQSDSEQIRPVISSPFVRFFFWVIVVLAVLFLVVPLITNRSWNRPGTKTATKEEPDTPHSNGEIDAKPVTEFPPSEKTANYPRNPGSIADQVRALVQRGQYRQALELILRSTVRLLDQHGYVDQPERRTSREIIAQTRLTDSDKAVLRDLLNGVELTHFGTLLPTAETVMHQLSLYERLSNHVSGQASSESQSAG